MKLNLEYSKGILVVKIKGLLVRKYTFKINSQLIPIIMKFKIKYVLVDATELDNIDDAGFDALMNLKCAVKGCKGSLYFYGTNKEILKKIKKIHVKSVNNVIDVYKKVVA